MVDEKRTHFRDIGLLWLRVTAGAFMLLGHGLPKLLSFSEKADVFPDPIGVGSTLSLALAVSAEAGCAILIVVGLATRLAAMPLVFTMLVAAFVIHGSDPWAKQEFALIYAIAFSTLALTGAGRWSIDDWWSRRRTSR